MDVHKLCKMANEIAAFFEADPDPAVACDGVASHLRRFWDPRMRRELIAWIDEHAGAGLKPSVLAAVTAHRKELLPAPDAR